MVVCFDSSLTIESKCLLQLMNMSLKKRAIKYHASYSLFRDQSVHTAHTINAFPSAVITVKHSPRCTHSSPRHPGPTKQQTTISAISTTAAPIAMYSTWPHALSHNTICSRQSALMLCNGLCLCFMGKLNCLCVHRFCCAVDSNS